MVDLAFRMLGDIADAEDVAQEAFLRLSRTRADELTNVRGWLTVVTGRLCLDLMGSARARRERPGDQELLNSVVSPSADPADRVTLDDHVRSALAMVLQRLNPPERVAFILHDVFAAALRGDRGDPGPSRGYVQAAGAASAYQNHRFGDGSDDRTGRSHGRRGRPGNRRSRSCDGIDPPSRPGPLHRDLLRRRPQRPAGRTGPRRLGISDLRRRLATDTGEHPRRDSRGLQPAPILRVRRDPGIPPSPRNHRRPRLPQPRALRHAAAHGIRRPCRRHRGDSRPDDPHGLRGEQISLAPYRQID